MEATFPVSGDMATANKEHIKRIWKPVRDQAADSLWMLLIVSMSITVLATRMFLELTGYPQVADRIYHIAHVLWGGLLLFIAVALHLSISNRYGLWVSAVLGGVGSGMFVDEVGKFITLSNDYFFPLAIPIIYSFILICVWLFYGFRKYRPRDARVLMYYALEHMKQVLDNDLDPPEYRDLMTELQQVTVEATDPNELHLAQALLTYFQSKDVRLASQPNLFERLIGGLHHTLANWPPRLALKIILVIGFNLMAFQSALKLVGLVLAVQRGPVHEVLSNFIVISGKSQYTINNPILLIVSTISVIGIGLLALIAAILLLLGHERAGIRIGLLGLVLALSIVNLFTFYFSQLAALVEAALQVFMLCAAGLYRWRFLYHDRHTHIAAAVEATGAPSGAES